MGFNLQLGDVLRSGSVTAIDDAIREIVRQEIARTPRSKFCESCAYMHQPEISARCCCVACHGDDVPAWAQRMNVTTPLSSEKTGDASPASEVKACPECGHTAEHLSSWISPRKDIPERLRFTCFEEGCQCSRLAAPAPVPFGSLGNDVEETLDALLGFGRSERMVERAQLRNEIAGLLSRRAPAPSPESEVVLDMPETDSGPLGRAQLEALHRLLAPVLDAAGFSPAHETAKKAIERLLAQWRSGLDPRVPPSPASFSLNPGASKTPGSQQASEELDELLRMHARHDNDDTEDCWTKPAVRAIQYLSDLRWDLQVTTNRAAILAETNESLRRMIADMAAYAGTTFGADEPVKNAEVVKKALAPSPASGEGARMTTREREEILKNDEIALAIADGMARCADVFCDQSQPDRRREAARMTHKRLADSRELLADLRAEAVAAWDAAEAAEERCSYKACGCMYDRKDDVCSVHSPIVSKVTAERDAARSELAALLAKSARRYAHMCRSEHVEVGFNDCVPDQPDELNCPVCFLRAEVERLEKRVTNLLSGTVESFEDGMLTILPHREMTTRMASALAGLLDECEAPNYVQMILSRAGEPGEPRKRYVVTVQRPEGKTPHQLREDAEKERDALRAEVDRLRTEHARLIAVINDDGSLENIDDIVSIAEDAMHAYNVQNKLIEEVERLRALMNTIRSNDRSEKYEIGEQRRDGATPIAGARFQTPREIVDMEEQRAANALRTALGAKGGS